MQVRHTLEWIRHFPRPVDTDSLVEEVTMGSPEYHLHRWVAAGLLDAGAADAIRDYERAESEVSARPTVVEALVYLAVAAIGAGVLALVSVNWEELSAPIRIALPALATAALYFTGMAMRGRHHPGPQRGGSVAWLATVAAAATTAAVAANEAGAAAEWVAAVAAATAMSFSILLWLSARTDIQVLALAGSAGLLSLAAAAIVAEHGSEDYASLAFGVSLVGCSAIAIALTEGGLLTPVTSARAFASAGLLLGVLYCSVSPEPAGVEFAGFIVAAPAALVSFRQRTFVYMAVAVLSVFMGLSTVILRHVDDPTVAAVAFIASGIALLGAIVVLERWRPWNRPDHNHPDVGPTFRHA